MDKKAILDELHRMDVEVNELERAYGCERHAPPKIRAYADKTRGSILAIAIELEDE